MNTKLMAHVTTGSRDGWGTVAPFLRGSLSFLADAFVEMSPGAFTIWRPGKDNGIYDWQGQKDDDIMPGFDQLTEGDMHAQAAYWWPIAHAAALAEEARLGIKIDAIKMTNEVGGGGDLPDTDEALRKLVAYERALLPLAEADGRKLLVGNCATDSPQWDDWINIVAPFIIEAAKRGHIYGRHAYATNIGGINYLADDVTGAAAPGGPFRVFRELNHFRGEGHKIPTIIGELGFYSFPGTEWFIEQIGLYDNLMQAYDELGGGCLFTYGKWNDGSSNIQAASMSLADYLRLRPFTEWTPKYEGPVNQTLEEFIAAVGNEIAPTNDEAALQKRIIDDGWRPYGRETWRVYPGDNKRYAIQPAIDWVTPGEKRPRRTYYCPVLEWGNISFVGDGEPVPPPDDPFAGLKFGQPLDVPWVTVPGGEFNAPRNYSAFGGKVNDKHEGIDAAPLTTAVSHVLNVYPGYVEYIGESSGYGLNVLIVHEYNGHTFTTRRAHMSGVLVKTGQLLGRGDIIGICGSTGNSTGIHDHLTMQSIDFGMSGYIVPNIIDPTSYYPSPVTPPPANKIAIDFLRADPQAWRVIRRADGSGEDVWDLPTDSGFVRVKNREQGEWYDSAGHVRYRDTSPAPDSQGNERLYIQTTNGTPGGTIAPQDAEVGKIYEFYSDVQFYAKAGCHALDESSGRARSTFQLVDIIENYEFPMTGFVVDKLYITMQTGEKQLYAIHNGRKLGWVGGGASQAGNEWAGELAELYFDRVIPQREPNRYCV